MEGEGEWEGRLEVCYSGRWGTVGADDWTETNSDVVCNAMGYARSGIAIRRKIGAFYTIADFSTFTLLLNVYSHAKKGGPQLHKIPILTS